MKVLWKPVASGCESESTCHMLARNVLVAPERYSAPLLFLSAIFIWVTTPSVLKYTTYDVEDKSIRINLLVLNVISIF